MTGSDVIVSPLDIRLFGRLEVYVEGHPLPHLRTRKGQWLFALLALGHDRAVERDWLAGHLWPDSPQSQALYSLRRSLTDLRRGLGSQAYRLQAPSPRTLCLDLTDASLDVADFDAAILCADLPSLEAAVALYAGPLLEGCFEEWVL